MYWVNREKLSMMNMDMVIVEGNCCGKVYIWFHLSKPLFSPLFCLGSCWTEISLQFSLETTLMSHSDLAHQYFTSKPNLLRMTTYHRQDMSFTAATFTFSEFSIYAHSESQTKVHTYTKTDCYFIHFIKFDTLHRSIPLNTSHVLYLDLYFLWTAVADDNILACIFVNT